VKNKILVVVIVVFAVLGFSKLAFGCAMSCAAVCRYTCEGTPQSETGCSDADYANSLRNCCTQAFANTPGIDNVPCTVSGPES
jgi:hypothetical protein